MLKEKFAALDEAQQAKLLFSVLSNTEGAISSWVDDNLDEDAYYEIHEGHFSTVDTYQELLSPLNKELFKELSIEMMIKQEDSTLDLYCYTDDVEGADNVLAASFAWDCLRKYLALKYYSENPDPVQLETLAFQALFTAVIAQEEAYYELGLPGEIDFEKLISGWGQYNEHEKALQEFEKNVFTPCMEEEIKEL